MLKGKKIVLAISGGIAAYKSAELTRLLIKSGVSVRVVMTKAATEFITPLTLQTLSNETVSVELFDLDAEATMSHIDLARWADLVLIAPATANRIARLAHGFSDDLISTLCLATEAQIVVAPAMNQKMYQHSATQANLKLLSEQNVTILGPGSGEQACGDMGLGRMLEPSEIVSALSLLLNKAQFIEPILSGQNWLITAGPTREALDPVRYLTNYSSGKMGFAIARAAAMLGAKVTLISGPVSLPTPEDVFERIDVTSALEMHQETLSRARLNHVFIASAAVADYRPVDYHEYKIKKDKRLNKTTQEQDLEFIIKLQQNPDIVSDVGHLKESRPFVVGFAAETNNLAEYAKGKLIDKKMDLICANDVSHSDSGFNSDFNRLSVYHRKEANNLQNQLVERVSLLPELSDSDETPLMDKSHLARILVIMINRLHSIHLTD